MKTFNFTLLLLFTFIIALLANTHIFAQKNVIMASNISPFTWEVPAEFKVYQNFPNPCYKSTTIKFDIASQSDAKLTIYDFYDNEVKCFIYNNIKPGTYQIIIDASGFSNGEYRYVFTSGEYTQSYQMTVLK